jgi:uncharacterized FlgJ-related protein
MKMKMALTTMSMTMKTMESGHVTDVVARCTNNLTGVTHDVTTAVLDRS